MKNVKAEFSTFLYKRKGHFAEIFASSIIVISSVYVIIILTKTQDKPIVYRMGMNKRGIVITRFCLFVFVNSFSNRT